MRGADLFFLPPNPIPNERGSDGENQRTAYSTGVRNEEGVKYNLPTTPVASGEI